MKQNNRKLKKRKKRTQKLSEWKIYIYFPLAHLICTERGDICVYNYEYGAYNLQIAVDFIAKEALNNKSSSYTQLYDCFALLDSHGTHVYMHRGKLLTFLTPGRHNSAELNRATTGFYAHSNITISVFFSFHFDDFCSWKWNN